MNASNDVDALIARANTLTIEEGPTKRVVQASAEAVAAARRLASQYPSRDNRRRLGRALWRDASIAATDGRGDAGIAAAWESVELVRSILRESSAAEAEFDDIVGECATHLADLALMFATGGDLAAGEQVLREGRDAVRLSQGPATRLAKATTGRITFKFAVQDAAERNRRHEQPVADNARLVETGQQMVALLWEVADEEQPTTLIDLADGLRDLGFAHIIAARHQQAANALAEAYAIFSCFDGPANRNAAETILTALARLGGAPGVQVVVLVPGTWRLTSQRSRQKHY
jgi:hypothetical protein